MRCHRRLLAGSIALTLGGVRLGAQSATVLAVADGNGGHVLEAVIERGRLIPRVTSASGLRAGAIARGLTFAGTDVRVTLDSVNRAYEPPDSELYLTIEGAPASPHAALFDSLRTMMDSTRLIMRGSDTTARREFFARFVGVRNRALTAHILTGRSTAVLAAFGAEAPTHLPTISALPPSELEPLLRRAADSLWGAALQDRDASERTESVAFGLREVRRVPQQPAILHVWIQALASNGDARGSFYFVYDETSRTLVHRTFGHPEWSPRSRIARTRPRMFFRLASDPVIYLLAEYGGAWEDYTGGWAILEAATGRLVARSH